MNTEMLQGRKKELEEIIIGLNRAIEQHRGRLSEVNEMLIKMQEEEKKEKENN